MKKPIVIILIVLYFANLFALTPHINKGKLEELTLAQGLKELQLSEKELKDINKEFFGALEFNTDFPSVMEADFDSPVQIFKQTFDETKEILYRVISHTTESTPFPRGGLFQKGYYSNGKGKPNLIFAEFYDATATVFGQRITSVQYNYNFMPVIKNNRIAGIMIYGFEQFDILKSIAEQEDSDDILYHKAAVYWNNDFSKADLRNTYSNRADIYIECSKPLIDENDTFKYTIQNAFDKNPATSYVEDTDDDLMFINFGLSYKNAKGKIEKINNQKIAIINGYAKNTELYKSNNRVKEINGDVYSNGELLFAHDEKIVLNDEMTDYQIFDWSPRESFAVQNIYKGSSFNDTCIAELDFFNKKMGWIFGVIK